MAIPKKGSRQIIIDGVNYRWLIRWKPTYAQAVCDSNLYAAVELYENPHSVLSILFPWVRYDKYFGVAEMPVTPKHIETCVKLALAQRWNPYENGKPFRINHSPNP